jgi:translation elongation factor EF-Tu-like GTPase
MAWTDSPLERRSIQSGMRVQTQDGSRLGRVMVIGREALYVRPWRFSRREFKIPLDRVTQVSGRGVVVAGGVPARWQPAGQASQDEVVTHIHPLTEPPSTGHAAS